MNKHPFYEDQLIDWSCIWRPFMKEMFPFHGKMQCGNKMVQHVSTTARMKDFCQKSHGLSVTLFLCDYTNCYLIGLTSNRRGSQVPKQFCAKPTMVDWVALKYTPCN